MKNNKVKYAKKRIAVKTITHRDDYIEVEFENFEYATSGVMRYNNSLFTLAELTTLERLFLDWLTEVMSADNSVYINDYEINRFIGTIAHTGLVYKPSSVRQALKGLRATGLLLKTKRASGLFNVNPVFFFRGSEKDRWDVIRSVMEYDISSDDKTNTVRMKIYREMKKLKK